MTFIWLLVWLVQGLPVFGVDSNWFISLMVVAALDFGSAVAKLLDKTLERR